jgi:hypothetical protein
MRTHVSNPLDVHILFLCEPYCVSVAPQVGQSCHVMCEDLGDACVPRMNVFMIACMVVPYSNVLSCIHAHGFWYSTKITSFKEVLSVCAYVHVCTHIPLCTYLDDFMYAQVHACVCVVIPGVCAYHSRDKS